MNTPLRKRSLPALAFPTLFASACSLEPDPEPVPGGARLIAPLSGSVVASNTPTLHFEAEPGLHQVDVCADRACAVVEQVITTDTNSAAVEQTLSPGVHFWRVRSEDESTPATVWSFQVRHDSSGADVSQPGFADFDADGRADAAFALPAFPAAPHEQHAYIYRGLAQGLSPTATLLSLPDAALVAKTVPATSAGDLDGDGYSDLVVAAQRDLGAAAQPGAVVAGVYVFFGGPDGLASEPSQLIEPPSGGAGTPPMASVLGDVDRDGYADVAVAVTGPGFVPSVYVYFGGASGLDDARRQLVAMPASPEHITVAAAGDVDGDGFADLVGRGGGFFGPPMTLHLWLGSSSGFVEEPAVVIDTPSPDAIILAMTGGLDVTGDGLADIVAVISDPFVPSEDGSEAAPPTTRVHLWAGQPGGITSAPLSSFPLPDATYNPEPSRLGDVDGDGYDDLALRVDGEPPRAFIFRGSADGLSAAPSPVLLPPSDDPELAFSFASVAAGLGDVNGDTFADVFAFGTGPTAPDAPGTSFVYLGATTGPAAAPSHEVDSPLAYTEF